MSGLSFSTQVLLSPNGRHKPLLGRGGCLAVGCEPHVFQSTSVRQLWV